MKASLATFIERRGLGIPVDELPFDRTVLWNDANRNGKYPDTLNDDARRLHADTLIGNIEGAHWDSFIQSIAVNQREPHQECNLT